MKDEEARRLAHRVEDLLARVDGISDRVAAGIAAEAVAALSRLYGEALARVLRIVQDAEADTVGAALTHDELVAQLLLAHGLHPDGAEERVQQALESLRGVDARLESITNGTAQVSVRTAAGASLRPDATLSQIIEAAVFSAAPELSAVQMDGGAASRPLRSLPMMQVAR